MNRGLDESIKKQRLLLWTTLPLIGKTETKKKDCDDNLYIGKEKFLVGLLPCLYCVSTVVCCYVNIGFYCK